MSLPIAPRARIYWQNLTLVLVYGNRALHGQPRFIEMPEAIRTLEAPPLFVIGDEGPELTNYRVVGKYYVVDRLFAKAELRLGTGWGQKKVQIYRQTPIAGGARG